MTIGLGIMRNREKGSNHFPAVQCRCCLVWSHSLWHLPNRCPSVCKNSVCFFYGTSSVLLVFAPPDTLCFEAVHLPSNISYFYWQLPSTKIQILQIIGFFFLTQKIIGKKKIISNLLTTYLTQSKIWGSWYSQRTTYWVGPYIFWTDYLVSCNLICTILCFTVHVTCTHV